jgi:predicted glycosyltransferase involved in capsule biosynthesis
VAAGIRARYRLVGTRRDLVAEAPPVSDSAPDAAAGPIASIIVPLRVSPALFEWEARLRRILAAIPPDRFEIVVVDDGTAAEFRPTLEKVVAGTPARLVRVEGSAGRPFAIGRARDAGVVAATAPVVLFNDVDFIAPEATYHAVADEIGRQDLIAAPSRFLCIPVVFLSEAETARYLDGGDAAREARHASLGTLAQEADEGAWGRVVYGSSCMVVNRAHYLALGGHDPAFSGHGAEDFELMHRLVAFDPLAPRPPLYAVDFKDPGIRHYRGFRSHFALHGIAAFERGVFLVHLDHPARAIPDYFGRQRRNFRALRHAMARFDRTGENPPALPGAAGPPRQGGGRMLPLDDALFRSFGGAAGMARAIASAEASLSAWQRLRGLALAPALLAYRLAMIRRLTRRERILLRHVPAEGLAARRDAAARLILRLLGRGAP